MAGSCRLLLPDAAKYGFMFNETIFRNHIGIVAASEKAGQSRSTQLENNKVTLLNFI